MNITFIAGKIMICYFEIAFYFLFTFQSFIDSFEKVISYLKQNFTRKVGNNYLFFCFISLFFIYQCELLYIMFVNFKSNEQYSYNFCLYWQVFTNMSLLKCLDLKYHQADNFLPCCQVKYCKTIKTLCFSFQNSDNHERFMNAYEAEGFLNALLFLTKVKFNNMYCSWNLSLICQQ